MSYHIIECHFLYRGILIRGQVAKVNVIVHGEMDVRCKEGRIRNHYIKSKPHQLAPIEEERKLGRHLKWFGCLG